MFLKGFQFGMLLQLAVGPVCLFVFKTATQSGFANGCSGAMAVVLVDALYILLAVSGVTAFWENGQSRKYLKWFGVATLLFFGATSFIEAFSSRSFISFPHESQFNVTSAFLRGLLLTASNPLTILFWSGLFAAKMAEAKLSACDLIRFGGGAVMATFCFLMAVSGCGSIAPLFWPESFIRYLNLAVGIAFIIFAVKLAFKSKQRKKDCQ